MRSIALSVSAVLSSAAAAVAAPVLQFDLNGFDAQARNSVGGSVAFGGITHTGSVAFSVGAGRLVSIMAGKNPTGFNPAAFPLTSFNGQINLANGQVTGGSLTVQINNGDTYTCDLVPATGAVSPSLVPPGGGFTIQALTNHGFFNDAQFGNLDVTTWFGSQAPGGLLGSLLQFNFAPDQNGHAASDMDLFVVAPLPPAMLGGLVCFAGIAALRRRAR